MPGELILTADCAYPFDFAQLPRRVKVILGYVGQQFGTPHLWTQAEVDAARASGRAWLPIWTPVGASLNGQLGKQAGNAMVEALAGYEGLAGCPVFTDIEYDVFMADQGGARDYWTEWQGVMHAAGHPQAWPYVPWAAQYGWVANWTGQRPKALPAGVIGWQYDHALDGDRWDVSVMAASVLKPWIDQPKGDQVSLSRRDRKFIVDQLQSVQDNVLARLRGIYGDGWDGHPHQAALIHLGAQLGDVAKSVGAAGPGQVDPAALAAAISADLGPQLAALVADELHRRLAS